MAIDVSVQICTYNRPDMALACLDALRGQTFPAHRFEVVVVDDGSDDDRLTRIDEAGFPFAVRVLRLAHRGLAGARNAGIQGARGQVVLFIDDDTIADPHLIEEHWRTHERYQRSVVLGWVNHVPDQQPRRRRARLADFSTSFFWTANASVRKDDLVAAGLFNDRFTEYGWEDLEIGDRLRELGLRRRINARAVVAHVKRPWRGTDVPALLRQAEASGRSAVLYTRMRPASWRVRLATGVSPLRIAANRLLEPAEGWYRRRVARAGDRPLRGVDWAAAYLWTRVAYFRSVRTSLGSRLNASRFSPLVGSRLNASPISPLAGSGLNGETTGARVKKAALLDVTPGEVKKAALLDVTPRVCVLRIDKIGDLLVTTPALRRLREALPDAHITLVTSPGCADVLRGWDALNGIEVYDPAAGRHEREQAVRRFRRLRPDAIFTCTPKSSIYRLARRIGAPIRPGFAYKSRPLDVAVARFAFTHPVLTDVPEAVERADEVPHHAEEMLWLLRAVGLLAEPCPMEVPVGAADRAWAAASLAPCGLPPILLHLSNKWLDDGWTREDVAALIRQLSAADRSPETKTGPGLVVTVGPSDARAWTLVRPLLDATQGRDKLGPYDRGIGTEGRDTLGPDDRGMGSAGRDKLADDNGGRARGDAPLVFENLPFGRWAALIAGCALVVSPDTGAIHVASATRRPVVGVYAAHRFHIFSRQWGPWMVPCRTLPKTRGADGVRAIAEAAEDLLREMRTRV